MCYARSQTFSSYITAVRTEAFQLITQCNLWLHFVVFWQSHFRSLSLLNPEGVGENWRLLKAIYSSRFPEQRCIQQYVTVVSAGEYILECREFKWLFLGLVRSSLGAHLCYAPWAFQRAVFPQRPQQDEKEQFVGKTLPRVGMGGVGRGSWLWCFGQRSQEGFCWGEATPLHPS